MKIIYFKNIFIRIYNSIKYKHYKFRLIFNNPKKYISNYQNKNINNPIFLLGVSSGGLTIISRIIRKHPNIISASGDNNFFYFLDEINICYKKFVPKKLDIMRKGKFYREFYGIKKFISSTIINKNEFLNYSKKYLKLLNAILQVYSKNPKKDRIIDKSQNNSLNIKFLDYVFRDKNPKYILIINNPYAVIAKSYLKLGNKSQKNLSISIEHFKNIFTKCLRDLKLSKNKFLIVKFDDFLINPEKTMRLIFKFLNLSFNKSYMPSNNDKFLVGDYKWYPIRKQTHMKYLKHLSKNDFKIINKKCSKIIKTFDIKIIKS